MSEEQNIPSISIRCETCLFDFAFGPGSQARINLEEKTAKTKCPNCNSFTSLPGEIEMEAADHE